MEPMNLGSPVNSPGSNQSQYLPPFLLGDPQNLTPHKNTLSPKTGRYVSFATSPVGSSSHELNRSGMNSRTLFGPSAGGMLGHNASGAGGSVNANTSSTIHNHQVGPPTQGLFDTLREPVSTPQRNPMNLLQLQSPNHSLNPNQSYQSYQSSYHTNDSFALGAPNAINASMRGLCSPLGATASPLIGGPGSSSFGASNAVGNSRIADFWVTIFGYSPGASSIVLQHFTLCGIIVDVVHAPQNGNWMHVRFSSRIESDKALNYNHKVIAGNVMVGVMRCTERSVIDKENSNVLANQGDTTNTTTTPSSPPIRSFAQQSYKLAQKDNAVSPNNEAPQKSSGLVDKAMDLLFGW